MKTKAASEMITHMSLNKALAYCGMSKHAWYYTTHPRDMPINPDVAYVVKDIASRRPTCGTRHKAQGTRHKAQGTRHKAQGTRHKADHSDVRKSAIFKKS